MLHYPNRPVAQRGHWPMAGEQPVLNSRPVFVSQSHHGWKPACPVREVGNARQSNDHGPNPCGSGPCFTS